jgi:hypothetical protein
MTLHDATRISRDDAQSQSEASLRRLLLWSLKNDPAEERIKRESMGTKEGIINALTWIGVIS